MLLLRGERIKKVYGERTVLEFEELSVYEGDRIGVIGANGAGKTTLFKLLAGELEPEEGTIQRFGTISYCRQFGEKEDGSATVPLGYEASLWKVPGNAETSKISGGEEMRRRLVAVFQDKKHILLLDEPTANLDSEGIARLTGQLKEAETFLCISHDRTLLNETCTQILEVADGRVRLYPGNYREYERLRGEERQKAEREYEEYVREKSRLEAAYRKKKESAERMVKIPAGMTPREARLRDFLTFSGRNSGGKQKSMNRAADNIKKRIDHMEVKEKPKQEILMRLNFSRTDPPESRKILEVKGLDFSYGDHVIFHEAAFSVSNRKKTALLGENGCGKTTLFHVIEKAYREGTDGVRLVPKARIGILRQDFSQLEPERTVLENAMAQSVQEPAVVKNVLAGLLFDAEAWNKKAEVLSGGERMKLAFAMLLVSAANVLLLDEPTNYLDLPSIRALEKQLQEYEGSVLFISHDREFVRSTAQELLLIRNKKVMKYAGGLAEYEAEGQKRLAAPKDKKERIDMEERMRQELRLARLTGQLGHAASLEEKERLEAEYWMLVEKLRR